jgi:hypothetical protein
MLISASTVVRLFSSVDITPVTIGYRLSNSLWQNHRFCANGMGRDLGGMPPSLARHTRTRLPFTSIAMTYSAPWRHHPPEVSSGVSEITRLEGLSSRNHLSHNTGSKQTLVDRVVLQGIPDTALKQDHATARVKILSMLALLFLWVFIRLRVSVIDLSAFVNPLDSRRSAHARAWEPTVAIATQLLGYAFWSLLFGRLSPSQGHASHPRVHHSYFSDDHAGSSLAVMSSAHSSIKKLSIAR